ncbi:HDIG domain-containing protein [Akkermansiaceae bacterium]|nr:HDIG domain-containing protein [Akkermansiaceae bacterium]
MGFIDTIKRWRLVQQGMSTGAKRRTQAENRVTGAFNTSPFTRVLLYLIFAALVVLLSLSDGTSGPFVNDPMKTSLFAILLTIIAVAIFEFSRVKTPSGMDILLVFGSLAVNLALTEAIIWIPETEVFHFTCKLLVLPYVLAPMIMAILLGRNYGIFIVAMYSLYGTLMMPSGYIMDFFIMSLMSGLVTVFLSSNVRKRASLLRAGFYAGITIMILGILLRYVDFSMLRFDDVQMWKVFVFNLSSALACSLIVSMVVGGILPILESAFGLITNIRWLELSDLNHPLLRKMQLEAPGTFHHSLVMASLAESAAESVGANASMCRVCAYFHDIGKLKKPEYFIENQGDVNPHDSLTPTMSALIIIAHVKDGIDLAIKHKLNKKIIDVIKEHHGDSLVYYFYRKAKETSNPEGDDSESKSSESAFDVDEKNFRYPGPKPGSKESGIISIADAIESASRTMTKPSPQKIRTLVEDIVKSRINDGQLDRCQLSLEELAKVKASFAKTLRSMLHNRIDYPKENDNSRTNQSH